MRASGDADLVMESWKVAPDEERVEGYFARLALPVRLVARELDALAREGLPGCAVGIKWGVPFYTLRRPVCYVSCAKKRVTFGLLMGADIEDPSGVEAEGEGATNAPKGKKGKR